MGKRFITLIPSHLVEGSFIKYGVSNSKRKEEVEELILAYRKSNGRDKRVRFMVGRYKDGVLKLMPYFLHKPNPLTEPGTYKAGLFIWGLSTPFRNFLVQEYSNGNLTEGESYTFKKRYQFTLLTPEEMDNLAASTIEYGKYDVDYSFEF